MSAPANEATMPTGAGYDAVVDRLFEPLRRACLSPRVATLAPAQDNPRPAVASPPAIQPGMTAAELETRLRDAQNRIAELETRLIATEHSWAAAERQITELEARNQELATDVDNALDQLSGHALHAEQERLVHQQAWSPWSASMTREGHDR
ncbi:hypothetical protein [Nocardia takedensis]|uniref:hypothetical protein n=1 Tax=Nocardia takedensis TaxID=259390 RepID=UPI000592E07A|nr:hypothetical protein [Nocardia takedensis]